jgi:hypothetical protein
VRMYLVPDRELGGIARMSVGEAAMAGYLDGDGDFRPGGENQPMRLSGRAARKLARAMGKGKSNGE